MGTAGRSRERLARILGAAFAEGLLSEQTLSYRLELLFAPGLIEPRRLVGDLTLSASGRDSAWERLVSLLDRAMTGLRGLLRGDRAEPAALVLALDWRGGQETLLVGRAADCDVALTERTVSRYHARLLFRDGRWVVQDLASKNGLTVNGAPVGRCALHPGDRLGLGFAVVEVD